MMSAKKTIVDPIIPGVPSLDSSVRRSIVLFGASWAKPGDELWAEAEKTGAEIAKQGFTLINGGYSGTMDASALGHEAASSSSNTAAERVGVIVPRLFLSRPLGNEHLTTAVHAGSLLQRIEYMIMNSDYFVVLKGTLGTLAELAAVWNTAMLWREGNYRAPRIYCVRKPWEAVVKSIVGELGVSEEFAAHIRFVDDGPEAVRTIAEDFEKTQAEMAVTKGGAGAMPSASS
jgi:uncharacterized protein (TIGR00725 family)